MMGSTPGADMPASPRKKSLVLGAQRALRVLLPALVVALPPLYWVVDATRRATLVSLGRDQGIFQYIAWAVLKGDVDYRDVRDVNGPLTHLVHIAFLKLGGADEHVFHVLDLVVSGVAFAFVGACIPGIGRRARPNPSGQGSAARWVREIASRSGWALAAWVVLSGQYLLYIFWDLAQRESFCDWFLLTSLGLQLVAQDRMRNGEGGAASGHGAEGAGFPGRAALVWAGALSLILWFGKPTYALFTVVQLATLLVDDVPTPRKRRLFAFAVGAALGAATQLLYLAVLGDLVVFFRTYLVDVPLMYRFIWPRTPYEILGLDGFSTLAAAAVATSAVMVSLIATGTLPRRALAIALAPLCGLASVLAQRKGFPYHFHPVSAGVSLQWVLLVCWYAERTFRVPRRRPDRLLPIAAGAALALRVATLMPISPYVQGLWLLTKARDPIERTSHDYLVYFQTSDFFPWELRQAASYLRLTTQPDERVQTYGMDPYVLFLAQRLSATPYIYAYDLNPDAALAGGNLPDPVGLHPNPVQARQIVALRDEHERDFLARLRAKPPAAFVFHDKAPLITWQESVRDFKEHCPESAAWVFASYTETANFRGTRVFLRNDRAVGAPRFDQPSAPAVAPSP